MNQYLAGLEKQAIGLETLGLVGGVHVGQNLLAARMLNRKGGRTIANELVLRFKNLRNPTPKSINKELGAGILNAAVPEKGIIKDHIVEALKDIPDLNYSERAILYSLGKGEFRKALNSPALERASNLKKFLKNKGVDLDQLLALKKIAPQKFDSFLKEEEKIHKKTPIGEMMSGIADGLRNVSLEDIRTLSAHTPHELLGEVGTNVALANIEPVTGGLNIFKRWISTPAKKATSIKSKIQSGLNKVYIKPMFNKSLELAEEGKRFNKIELRARKYVGNPVLAELANYINETGVNANKHFGSKGIKILRESLKNKLNKNKGV